MKAMARIAHSEGSDQFDIKLACAASLALGSGRTIGTGRTPSFTVTSHRLGRLTQQFVWQCGRPGRDDADPRRLPNPTSPDAGSGPVVWGRVAGSVTWKWELG